MGTLSRGSARNKDGVTRGEYVMNVYESRVLKTGSGDPQIALSLPKADAQGRQYTYYVGVSNWYNGAYSPLDGTGGAGLSPDYLTSQGNQTGSYTLTIGT